MKISEHPARGLRFSISKDGKEVAHAYLYILTNDLHDAPFGLLEDVSVDNAERGRGLGGELLTAVLQKAQSEHCHKLIATSRDDGTRQLVHEWYLRLGFRDYGTEFRMDF